MSHQFDDERPVTSPPGVRWWQVLAVLVVAAGFALTISFRSQLLPPTRQDRFTRQLREQILAGGDLRPVLREFDARKDRNAIAKQLAADPEPEVRRVAVELVLRNEPTVKTPIVLGRNRLMRPDSDDRGPDSPVLRKLLADPEPRVRQAVLRGVNGLAATKMYEKELLEVLWNGPEDERLVVCRWLGHWNGGAALAVFSSPSQSPAVRAAVFRSIQLWRSREFARGLDDALLRMLAEPDPRIRLLAVEASRWASPPGAVRVWSTATRSNDPAVAALAVAVWIDELTHDEPAAAPAGSRGQLTAGLLHRLPDNTATPPEVTALVGHVLCRAAMGHAEKLDADPTDQTVWHLRHVAHPLTELPRSLGLLAGKGTPVTFTAWLPHETRDGPHPPTRKLGEYLLEQMKGPAVWCEQHRELGGLRAVEPALFTAGEPDTLGRYLDHHRAGSFAELERHVREVTQGR